MARYIDCDKCYHGRVCAYRHHYHDVITDCNHHTPTADVVEVKHGKWEKLKYIGDCICPCKHTCGVCGKSYFDDNHNNYPFCPLCGAKMDGGKAE